MPKGVFQAVCIDVFALFLYVDNWMCIATICTCRSMKKNALPHLSDLFAYTSQFAL